MASRTTPSKTFSSELKLAVVLEFIKNPKRKKALSRKYGISEDLLDQWHRQFRERATAIFEPPSRSVAPSTNPQVTDQASERSDAAESAIPPWGAKINVNKITSYHWPVRFAEPVPWLKGWDKDHWSKRGVAIWENATEQFELLPGQRALDLLKQLREAPSFEEGVAITRQFQRQKTTPPAKEKPKRKRRASETPKEEPKREYETVEEERFRLSTEATAELFTFLQAHEDSLQQIAETDAKEIQEAWSRVYEWLFEIGRDEQEKKMDLATRPLPWVHAPGRHIWVCDVPPNRATVSVSETRWFWHCCIERPDEFKHWSPSFVELKDAIEWAEKELLSVKEKGGAGDEPEADDEPETLSAVDLTPFRIDPAALEPARVTYRVVMDLKASPESFKTMEMSFGKLFRYHETYPSPMKLTHLLGLSDAELKFEQPAGEHSRWYSVKSRTTYFQEYVAAMQAQQLWDRSDMVRQHQLGKITRARYGFEEVETHFSTWLGALDDPEDPWPPPKTRAEYLEERALEETLIHALDTHGFRSQLGMSKRLFPDETLLSVLHHRRARSKFVSAAAREESERWLKEHQEENFEN